MYPEYWLYTTQEKAQQHLDIINKIDLWANLDVFPACEINGVTYGWGFQKPFPYILNNLNPMLIPDLETEYSPEWRGVSEDDL